MPIVDANGIEIYYETAGSADAPPLLLIQGIGGNTEAWFAQIPALQKAFYVISFDNRGAGKSSQPGPGYKMADMADDTAALLEALDIPRAFVFGISMGGMIALNLAVQYPEKITKLALGCTMPGGANAAWPDEKVIAAMTAPSSGDVRQDLTNNLWFLVAPDFMEKHPHSFEQLVVFDSSNPQTETAFMGQFQAVTTHDVTSALAKLRVPTLVMHGDLDILIPFSNGIHLAEHIPGAEFEVYEDTGHLFYIEDAPRVNKRLREFFCL